MLVSTLLKKLFGIYMRCPRHHPTCKWASQLSGMFDTLGGCLHVHTRHSRPDAVTVQLDPAASFGLNLDDFLCVSDIRYYVSGHVRQRRISPGLAGHVGCTG